MMRFDGQDDFVEIDLATQEMADLPSPGDGYLTFRVSSNGFSGHMCISRRITVRRMIPGGSDETREMSPVELVFEDADCRFLMLRRPFPTVEQFNLFLSRGWGDDGFFPHVWDGFALTDEEYRQIVQRTERKRR